MFGFNKNKIEEAIKGLQSVIDEIKVDGSRIIAREKDGKEEDLTDVIVPIMEFALAGMIETKNQEQGKPTTKRYDRRNYIK